MQSTIKMEFNFDTKEPFIRVWNFKKSDDLRDRVISQFRYRFKHTSTWCKVFFAPEGLDTPNCIVYDIYPISPESLRAEAKIMMEQADLLEKNPEQPALSH